VAELASVPMIGSTTEFVDLVVGFILARCLSRLGRCIFGVLKFPMLTAQVCIKEAPPLP
jgi:hypothetical protein